MPQKHFDGNEIDENGAFVGRRLFVTMFECVGQIIFRRSEIVVEHMFAPHVEFVSHLLRFWVSEILENKNEEDGLCMYLK